MTEPAYNLVRSVIKINLHSFSSNFTATFDFVERIVRLVAFDNVVRHFCCCRRGSIHTSYHCGNTFVFQQDNMHTCAHESNSAAVLENAAVHIIDVTDVATQSGSLGF